MSADKSIFSRLDTSLMHSTKLQENPGKMGTQEVGKPVSQEPRKQGIQFHRKPETLKTSLLEIQQTRNGALDSKLIVMFI